MFTKRVYLYCDGNAEDCECQGYELEAQHGDPLHRTQAKYKKEMQGRGWLFRKDNKAYCPACRKKIERPE